MNESKSIDVTNEVYNALADIAFKTGCSKDDMSDAISWFYNKFYIEAEQEEEG